MARSLTTRYAQPVPVIRPPQGTTFAREAAGNASTFVPPTLAPGAMSQVLGGTPAAVGTALQSLANPPPNTAPLGTAYGSSRILAGPQSQGSAYLPTAQPQVANQNGSGIYVNGVAQNKDAKGNFVADPTDAANAPGTVTPAQKFAADQAVILAEHPEIGVAGSEANKKFLAAYKESGNNPENILATARQTFGAPTQTANAVNPKDADAALIPAAIAKGNQVASNPFQSDAAKAGAAIPKAIGGAANSVVGALDTGAKATGDFLGGVFGQSQAQRTALANTYGQDTSNIGSDFFNARVAPPTTPAPTGTPVAPPTNNLAANPPPTSNIAPTPAITTGALSAPVVDPTPAGPQVNVNGTAANIAGPTVGLNGSPSITPGALTAPVPPVPVDPAEEERRRKAAAANS